MKVKKRHKSMEVRLKSLTKDAVKCFLWEEDGKLLPGMDVYIAGQKFSVSSDPAVGYRQVKEDLARNRYHSQRHDHNDLIEKNRRNRVSKEVDFDSFCADFAHEHIRSLGNRSVVIGFNGRESEHDKR